MGGNDVDPVAYAQALGASAARLGRGLHWALNDRKRHFHAFLHRKHLSNVLFVGITGSAGKTSTKDFATRVLSTLGECQCSDRSGNEHSRVEETVLSTRREHRFCVVEMSASEPDYLNRSIRVVRPRIAVLTVVALEHFSAFRSIDAIAAEKRKLIDALPPGGVAVLNRDDPQVRAIGESRAGPTIWVGRDEGATVRLIDAQSAWPAPLTLVVEFEGKRYELITRLHGMQLVTSLLCALGVGLAADVRIDDALEALGGATNSPGRMQVETLEDGVTFVRDDFKAPQWSLQAPLDFLREAHARRKVAVIGTISDTPNEPARRYAKAARAALEVADLVLLVGPHTISTERANRIRSDGSLRLYPSTRDAAAFLRSELRSGDVVLLKGTNKADHLVRILLDRRKAVQCWESSCRKIMFCDECPRAWTPVSEFAGPTAPATARTPASTATGSAPRPGSATIVVGLGNPGDRYRHTVHNVGQLVLDRLAERTGASWATGRHGLEARLSIDGSPAILLKLDQPMNCSGNGLSAYLEECGYQASDCIVVLDDADLPLGRARVKRNGGDAGHKGMRSILQALSTDVIRRVRVGVRGRGEGQQASEFVLSRTDTRDDTILAAGLATAERLTLELMTERSQHEIASAR